ncbi:hypothetical protein DCC81_06220 [Chitinophaga parva]|uniref:Uncharacterized protein n=1 Tax=Chitinophaga parva TaxID=2169414 RepID=A0A2T7BN15_9BACT|nr:hypothetical protein DCC81_06220 [Chitinophaga parva]
MEKVKKQVVTPNATAAAYAKKATENIVHRSGHSTADIVRASMISKNDVNGKASVAKKNH